MSYMNRMANAGNRFQGPTKRVLCVCSAGLLRSPTTANVLHQEYGYNTRSAGSSQEYALIPLDPVLIDWANEIVWVSQRNYDEGWSEYKDILKHKRNIVLAIPDKYEWNDPDLRAIIKKQYADTLMIEETTNFVGNKING